MVLQRTPQRPGAELRVVPGAGQPFLGGVGQLEPQTLGPQLVAGARDHQVDNLHHLLDAQLVEDDRVVDAVQELGPELRLERVVDLLLHPLVARTLVSRREAHPRLAQVGRAQVGGHDEHGVAEVDRAPLRVGQPALLENLQQRVEDVRVGLLDLVEQHHRERLAAHCLGELAALVVADVPGRCADETAHRELVPCTRTCPG